MNSRLAPPPDSRWGCAEWGCAALLVLVVGAVLFPGFTSHPGPSYGASCLSNIKQLSSAMQMYSQDFDGYLPPASAWQDLSRPYVKYEGTYRCPLRRMVDPGYAFNQLLDGAPVKKSLAPEQTPLLFESSLGQRNGADRLQSFVMPHNGRGNVGFVDGHARLLKSAPSASDGLREGVPLYRQRDAAP